VTSGLIARRRAEKKRAVGAVMRRRLGERVRSTACRCSRSLPVREERATSGRPFAHLNWYSTPLISLNLATVASSNNSRLFYEVTIAVTCA
jgi:hypothetical protein